jgi:uncharacterized membrane protein YdfJ with MMPL/SSD domain
MFTLCPHRRCRGVLTNILSLTAAFGAVVWVFQEGHLGALGTAATGALGVQLPVLLFCIAFGLSMDYEVFLFSRIREYWLASHRGWGASVARGVARTGRVITAAALIMVISFAALMAAQVSVMRLFGFGLTALRPRLVARQASACGEVGAQIGRRSADEESALSGSQLVHLLGGRHRVEN